MTFNKYSKIVIIYLFCFLNVVSIQSSKYAIGVTRIIVKIVRSIHITISFGILIGISVAKIQGISAEKNRIAETDTTAIINFVIKGASTTSKDGKNISAISVAAALAASS